MTWLKGFSQVIDNDFRLRLFFNEDPPTVDLKEYLPLLPKRKLLILTARNTHTHIGFVLVCRYPGLLQNCNLLAAALKE